MTTTTLTMIDRVEEALAQLWLQLDHIGDSRFQEDIERLSDAFPLPEGSLAAKRVTQQTHELFRRVHSVYTERLQRRSGHRLVRCPRCTAPVMEVGS